MPYSSQYYGRWQNLARDKVGRFVLWFVKWFMFIGIVYAFSSCIIKSLTEKDIGFPF